MNMLTCKKCLESKSETEFPKDHRNKSGYSTSCKHCENIRRKQSATWRFRYTPSVTKETFESMIKSQNGVCDICKQPATDKKRLCVDHCHTTAKVRGLLCDKCNRILGQWNDDITVLQNAIEYLTKHS